MPEVVYRSTHPDVLAHWKNAQDADAAWRKRVEAALVGLGFPDRDFATRGQDVIGVAHPAGEDVPLGWRQCPDLAGAIVPARSTRDGKRYAAVLDDLTRPNPREGLPGGMPGEAFAKHRIARMHPGMELVAGVLWVSWSSPLGEQDTAGIDPGVWERVPLSQYHAMREAAEATVGGAS